jgi:hypothetical protein
MYESLVHVDSVCATDLPKLVLDLLFHNLVNLLPLDPFLLVPRLLLEIFKELINRVLPLFMLLLDPPAFLLPFDVLLKSFQDRKLDHPPPVKLSCVLPN